MNKAIKTIIMTGIPMCILISLTFIMSYAGELKTADISTGTGDCASKDTQERGTISVTGEAKDYFSPDIATINLAVETSEKTANEAVLQNSKKAEKVVKTLKLLISPDRGDSIKTSSYTVQPVYEYDNVRKKSVLTGYRARHQVTVRTEKIESAGMIIDNAVQNGANEVMGVNFALMEVKEYCDGVYKKAADKARREAAFVAQALGTKITGIKSITPSCGMEAPRPIYRQAMTEVMAAPAETTIETGDIAVNASVNIVFYIEKK